MVHSRQERRNKKFDKNESTIREWAQIKINERKLKDW